MADSEETTSVEEKQGKAFDHFNLDMTMAEAMGVHPRVAEVFMAFQLGGCGQCAMAQVETLGQMCEGYAIDPDTLLGALEGVFEKPQ